MFLRTWNCPNHLCTPMSWIIGVSAAAWLLGSDAVSVMAYPPRGVSVAGIELALEMLAVARHAEAEDPESQPGEDVALDMIADPFGIGGGRLDDAEQIEQADDEDQRGILEQRDEGTDDAGNDVFQRLRQDHQPHHAPVAEAHRLRRLVLAL